METDGQTWWSYRSEELIGRQITRIALGHHGELLVGTDNGLYVIDDSSGRVTARLLRSHVDPAVTAIAVDADRYWVAYGKTIVGYTTGTISINAVECFSVDSPVNDLLPDKLGNVFIATNNSGLAMVSCLRQAVQRIELGREGGIYSIKAGTADSFTIGGDNIFGKIVLPSDTNFTSTDETGGHAGSHAWDALAHMALSSQGWRGLPDTTVWDSIDDGTYIWVATQAGLYRAPHGGKFALVHERDPILGAPNRVLLQRDAGMWVGTLHGLACIRDGHAEPVDGGGAPLGYVYALYLDDLSALWVGTLGRGLWRENQGLEAMVGGPLTPDGNTYLITQGPEGRIIVLQDEKVVLLNRDLKPHLVTTLSPVSGWTATWLDARTIAIGASDGLRIVDIDSGRVTRHIQSLFRPRDWEFTNNRTLLRDRQGRLLCGLNGGLARVDLEKLRIFEPPVCKLVDIVWTGAEPESDGTTTRVRPGRWTFRVRAFSAWFVESAKIRYQFKLIGFDNTWTPAQERPDVTFTSLPPGEYRLACRAYSPLVGHGPEAELLRLEVRRPIWAMGWSAALGLIESIYDRQVRARERNDSLLEENRALELYVAESNRSLLVANRELEISRDAYQLLAEVDELTRLGNRRNFEREIIRAVALTKRLNVPLALIMIDIDHFKMVNDNLGHQTGDEYLRNIGHILAAAIRVGEDVAARYGGEEFAVLLLNTDTEGALVGAERIRQQVEALALPNKAAPAGIVTVSIGVAALDPGTPMTKDELVARADRALYRAKNGGRNQVSA